MHTFTETQTAANDLDGRGEAEDSARQSKVCMNVF